MLPARRLLALAGVASAVAACTGKDSAKQPSVDDFAVGVCRQAAPAVIGIGGLVTQVQDKDKTAAEVNKAITDHQAALRKLLPTADLALRPHIQEVVTTVGFFRIGVDSNTLQPETVDRLAAAQEALVRMCTPTPTPTQT